MQNKTIEILVGLFMIAGLLGMLILAFKVSGISNINNSNYYVLNAEFDNIGGLKVRAPVRTSGVTVGYVHSIVLDPRTFRAAVAMKINGNMKSFPLDTAANIYTEGLLGSNYIGLTPGFDIAVLKSGDKLQTTHSALILENLIGQLLFSLKGDKK